MKSVTSTLIIFISCFQLAFAETLVRIPAALDDGSSMSLEELEAEIKSFKNDVAGYETLPKSCKKAELKSEKKEVEPKKEMTDEDILALIASLKNEGKKAKNMSLKVNKMDEYQKSLTDLRKNACGQYIFEKSAAGQKTSQDKCTPKRVKGLIDKQADFIVKLESSYGDYDDEVRRASLTFNNKNLSNLYRRAQSLANEIKIHVRGSRLELEQRQDLLIQHYEGIVMPFRDFVTLLRSYRGREYGASYEIHELLFPIPYDIICELDIYNNPIKEGSTCRLDKEVIASLLVGKNPALNGQNSLSLSESPIDGFFNISFDQKLASARDIKTLMKAPTQRNYLRVLKWLTIQSMFTQQTFLRGIMGDIQGKIDIPRSCQNHQNGSFSEEMSFSHNPDKLQGQVLALMKSSGLLYGEDNSVRNYFLDDGKKNPLEDGYTGFIPFEKHHIAEKGIEDGNYDDKLFRAELHDVYDFDAVVSAKMEEASSVFAQYREDARSEYLNGKEYVRNQGLAVLYGEDIFKKVMKMPEENEQFLLRDDGKLKPPFRIDFENSRVSVYLAEVMQRYNTKNIEDILSKEVKSFLNYRKVKIEFPSLYTVNFWRHWALRTLNEGINEAISKLSKKSVQRAKYEKTLEKLSLFIKENSYTPLERVESDDLLPAYREFQRTWKKLSRDRKSNFYAKTNITEYSYILNQLKIGNPWARTRLGYLVAKSEAEKAHRQKEELGSLDSKTENCFSKNTKKKRDSLRKVFEGIFKLNRTLKPSYSTEILSEEEFTDHWKTVKEEFQDETSGLYYTKIQGQTVYDHLQYLSTKTTLTPDSIRDFADENLGGLSEKSEEILEIISKDEEIKKGLKLFEIYKNKGNEKKQEELFKEYVKEYRENANPNNLPYKFFQVDSALKKVIFVEALGQASQKRYHQITKNMDKLCQLGADDFEDFREIYFITLKQQNKLSEITGGNPIPAKILERIQGRVTAMSPDEKKEFMLAMGLMVFLIGAAIFTGGAAAAALGPAASVVIGGSMITAFSLQTKLLADAYNRKIRSEEDEEFAKLMYELGFGDRKAAKELHTSWAWTIIEAAGLIPLVGLATKSASLSVRIAKNSTSIFFKNLGKTTLRTAWKESGRAAAITSKEVEVLIAKQVLGYSVIKKAVSVSKKDLAKGALKVVKSPYTLASKALENFRKVRSLYGEGKISWRTLTKAYSRFYRQVKSIKNAFKGEGQGVAKATQYISKATVPSFKETDRMTVKSLMDLFDDNPTKFVRLLESIIGKTPSKLRIMEKTKEWAEKGRFLPMTNWLFKSRADFVIKNHDYLSALVKEAKLLSKESKNGNNIFKFKTLLATNLDELTKVFQEAPARKREWLYMLVFQGLPHAGDKGLHTLMSSKLTLKGLGLGALIQNEGIMVRKIFNARTRLIAEKSDMLAGALLGTGATLGSRATHEAFTEMEEGIIKAAKNGTLSKKQARKATVRVAKMQDSIVNTVHKNILAQMESEAGVDAFMALLKKSFVTDAWLKKAKWYSWFGVTSTILDGTKDIFMFVFSKLVKLAKRGETKAFKEVMSSEDAKVFIKAAMFGKGDEMISNVGVSLWRSTPANTIFNHGDMEEHIIDTLKSLRRYKHASAGESYFRALFIRTIQKNRGSVEVM